jgi:hypothetical protein
VIKSIKIKWARHVARMTERRVTYRVLVGKPDRKRPFGKLTCRWDDNSNIDFQEVGWGACTD